MLEGNAPATSARRDNEVRPAVIIAAIIGTLLFHGLLYLVFTWVKLPVYTPPPRHFVVKFKLAPPEKVTPPKVHPPKAVKLKKLPKPIKAAKQHKPVKPPKHAAPPKPHKKTPPPPPKPHKPVPPPRPKHHKPPPPKTQKIVPPPVLKPHKVVKRIPEHHVIRRRANLALLPTFPGRSAIGISNAPMGGGGSAGGHRTTGGNGTTGSTGGSETTAGNSTVTGTTGGLGGGIQSTFTGIAASRTTGGNVSTEGPSGHQNSTNGSLGILADNTNLGLGGNSSGGHSRSSSGGAGISINLPHTIIAEGVGAGSDGSTFGPSPVGGDGNGALSGGGTNAGNSGGGSGFSGVSGGTSGGGEGETSAGPGAGAGHGHGGNGPGGLESGVGGGLTSSTAGGANAGGTNAGGRNGGRTNAGGNGGPGLDGLGSGGPGFGSDTGGGNGPGFGSGVEGLTGGGLSGGKNGGSDAGPGFGGSGVGVGIGVTAGDTAGSTAGGPGNHLVLRPGGIGNGIEGNSTGPSITWTVPYDHTPACVLVRQDPPFDAERVHHESMTALLKFAKNHGADVSVPTDEADSYVNLIGHNIHEVRPFTYEDIKAYPMIFITGDRTFEFTPGEMAALRKYVLEDGGTIYGEDCHDPNGSGGRGGFDAPFKQYMQQIFNKPFRYVDLESHHPIYNSPFKIDHIPPDDRDIDREPFQMINIKGRDAIIYTVNDYGDQWNENAKWVKNDRTLAYEVGVNLYTYAVEQYKKAHG